MERNNQGSLKYYFFEIGNGNRNECILAGRKAYTRSFSFQNGFVIYSISCLPEKYFFGLLIFFRKLLSNERYCYHPS